ncbi:LOW QUALITY PROTEIN: cilia- and flagella-associated protein 57-like [Melanaphis sacchari]|uniref:LOW QUALITY PROTEIN: cilia- and flagella-associated protein 57-like n=1 Tax=Melanaphis sacchari TaxID=742174 RepID=UPI000DC14FA0|nr:LOW QUALITY PROTEIN: cilia- and flagella-associated protein 57-like [Melanaphis sacchari]
MDASVFFGSSPTLDLEPKFVFGITNNVPGNCLYWKNDVIVYPAMSVIVIYNTKDNTQKFIYLTEGSRRVITAMDLNTNNHVLAVATIDEKESVDGIVSGTSARPVISIYDLRTLDLKHVFQEPDNNDNDEDGNAEDNGSKKTFRRRFTKIHFLWDNIFVAALVVGGHDGSDCTLYYYSWRNSTIETYVRINGPVSDMALNPIDTAICCFVGKELFRLMTKPEKDWQQYGFREADGIHFTCVCWLCGDRCLAGTIDGNVILFKNGDPQAVYRVDAISEIDVTIIMTEIHQLSMTTMSANLSRNNIVRSCFTFEFGLVLLVGDFTIYHFRKMDEGRRYEKTYKFIKEEYRYLQQEEVEDELPMHYIESVCISPNSKILTFITKRPQLYHALLSQPDENDDESTMLSLPTIPGPLGVDLHHGVVESLSTSLWKPILMTCGKLDYTIKVWDYVQCTLLLSKHYPKPVCIVSMHPTGLYSLAAFSDHLEFQMVQMDDLVPLKIFPVRNCTAVTFSGSGHMFAVAKPGAIEVYCSLMFVKCFSCLGHLGPIEKLVWCNHDMNIVAYDIVGAICTFDTKTGKVLTHIAPYTGAAYTDLAVGQDVNQLFVIAKDGSLKEVYDRKVKREVNFYGVPLNAVSVSKSNLILFIAAENGVILTVILPMGVQIEYKEFKIHSNSIKKMCLATDGSVLISCSEDSNICVWEVKNTENITRKIEKTHVYTDDILVNLSKYDKLQENIKKIETAVNKLETENTINLNTTVKAKEQEIKDINKANTTQYYETIKKNEEEQEKQKKLISKLKFELNQLTETNEQSIINLESYYNKQLVYKYKKFSILENYGFQLTSGLQKNLEAVQDTLDKELQEAASNNEKKLREKLEDILQSKEKLINEKNNTKMLVGDTENNVDENVFSIKNKFTDKLNNLKDLYSKTMSALAEDKIKYNLYKQSIDELRRSSELLTKDMEELKLAANKKKNRIFVLTRLIKQCKEIIPQKNIQILDVKQQMSLLVKDLKVLKEDIIELEQTTEPLELEIQEIKNLNDQIDIKLEVDIDAMKSLNVSLEELIKKRFDTKTELNKKRQHLENLSNIIKQMEIDIRVASQVYHNTLENKRLIINFFKKHVGETEIREIEEREIKGREEFFKQDDFLKRRIKSLRNMLNSFGKKNKFYYLTMEENTNLMKEINNLRKNANTYLKKYNNLKNILEMEEIKKDTHKGVIKKKKI